MDDITTFLEGRSEELAGIAEKVQKSIRGEGFEAVECSKKEGAGLAISVEHLRVDLRTRAKQQRISEELHEDWGENAVENGFGSHESVARTSCGQRAHTKG